MQPAAIGIRPHSGWGAAVVVAGGPGAIEMVDRRKIVITDPTIQGANQPYHFAKELPIRKVTSPNALQRPNACLGGSS